MKKIFVFIFAIMLSLSLIACSNELNESVDNGPVHTDDSIMYNNAYEYSDKEIKFILKERGYELKDEYNGKETNLIKKEVLAMLSGFSGDNEYLYYEVYNDNDKIALRGIMYPEGDYFYSTLTIPNLKRFSGNVVVKVLSEDNTEIYSFEVKEVK